MPRPDATPDRSVLCERLQQLRQQLDAPRLLQAWRKRIDAMDDDPRRACRGLRALRRPDAPSDAPASPPPLHPRLQRQQAACALSGLCEIYAKPRRRPCGRDEPAD